VRGNRLAASRILRVSYKTMLNKITEYGLTVSSGRARPPFVASAPAILLPPPISPDAGASPDAK
jgi:hypothetical protein